MGKFCKCATFLVWILSLLLATTPNWALGDVSNDPEGGVFLKPGLAHSATSAELERARHQFERLVVMLYAPWCSACEALKPKFYQAATESGDDENVRFLLVDASADIALALQYDLEHYPLVVLIVNDEVWQWNRGTTLTLTRLSHGESHETGVTKYRTWTGPYSRIGLWKYRVGNFVQTIIGIYNSQTSGKGSAYKLLWLVVVSIGLAICVVTVLLGTTWLFTPPIQPQNPHEE